MKGEIAQMMALTCYGNAAIAGAALPRFFPDNSTCNFCDSVKFVEFKKGWFAKVSEQVVASTPDIWLKRVAEEGARVWLTRSAQNNPRISDRMAAAFVGGGGSWRIAVDLRDGNSEIWAARWEVWNQNAPEKRIWRVTYGMIDKKAAEKPKLRTLAEVKSDLEEAIVEIHQFASRNNCEGFTECFARAYEALRNPKIEIEYYKDLFVPGTLASDAEGVLRAGASAWVFGGMGSWNDLVFEGADQEEYDRVSEKLFNAINEAIEIAASQPTPGAR